jgi:hypothetical protein
MTEREERAGEDAPIEPGGDSLPSGQTEGGAKDVPTGNETQEAPSGGASSSGTSSGQP